MQHIGLEVKPKRNAIVLIIIMAVSAALAGTFVFFTDGSGSRSSGAISDSLSSFGSYSQLQSFISENAKNLQEYNNYVNGGFIFGGVVPLQPGSALSETIAAATADSGTPQSTPAFTGTNVQVQGVDEPDLVKTDGTYIFVSTTNSVVIINAYPPNSTSIVSRLQFSGSITGLEISRDRLLVIDQIYSGSSSVGFLLYNTTDISLPKLIQNVTIDGNYITSRLAQGYFYAVVQQPSYTQGSGTPVATMPTISVNGGSNSLAPSSIYYTPNKSQIEFYTMILSLNMSSGEENSVSVLTGPSSTIYVSQSSIYVVYANYMQFYADNIPGDVYSGGVIGTPSYQSNPQNSTIFRAGYSNGNVAVEAVGTIPGTVLNQFSLDEYNGYFRVATSRIAQIGSTYTRSDDVYVLNMNLSQVSSLLNIAPGENIYAVSFVGSMGYVVTFEQVDPLFAISFQDMSHPVILSALKVNGYSDYLYPLPNGYLIGIGKDTVPSSSGNYSYYLGLKVSLFHVLGNGTSVQVAKLDIGDRGTDSPVLTDHLAFTFDSTRNIMVLPVSLAIVSGNQTTLPSGYPAFGDTVWQGAYVFNVTNSGFSLMGKVSQYPPGQANFGDSANGSLQILRTMIIGNYLYTISQGELMVSDLSSFSTVATVTLP
jgi:inhibitor of cysteine peptidase